MLPLSRVPAASKAPSVHATTSPAAISLRSSVLALTSDLQDFAPFAPETPSSSPGSRENNLAGRFLPTLCPAPGGPCYQPPSDYYCSLSKESSLESQGSSTLSSPSECLSAQPAGTPDCSPRGTSAATLFQFPISKILEEEEETAASCTGHDHNCFQGEQAQEETEERSPPTSEDTCPPPSPCRPSPKRGPGDGPQGAEEIQRYRAALHPLLLWGLGGTAAHPACRVCDMGSTVILPLSVLCRVVLSVNDKWHYCQNSDILVGSRAMRDRHLRLLGYCLVQVRGGLPLPSPRQKPPMALWQDGLENWHLHCKHSQRQPSFLLPCLLLARGSSDSSSQLLFALPSPHQDFFHAAGGKQG